MICLQKAPELLIAVGFSLLIGCGSGETTTSTTTTSSTAAATSSGGVTTGTGGAGGDASSGGAGGSGGAAVVLGDVDVTVNYAGAQTGTLSIAAVSMFPPMGPPVAFQSFKTPMYPQKGTLIGLEATKDYYIVAVLDIGNNNPQSPGPEDLVAVTMPAVKVTPDHPAEVNLTLVDK